MAPPRGRDSIPFLQIVLLVTAMTCRGSIWQITVPTIRKDLIVVYKDERLQR